MFGKIKEMWNTLKEKVHKATVVQVTLIALVVYSAMTLGMYVIKKNFLDDDNPVGGVIAVEELGAYTEIPTAVDDSVPTSSTVD